jgi:acyl carrier protein
LEELGAEVLTCSLDITDRDRLEEVKNLAEERFSPINGVIHAGGISGGGVMQLQSREKIEEVLRSKVQGMLFLSQIFEERALDFMILCSSASTILPGFGQVDYVAANAFLDAFADYNTLYRGTFTTAVNWGRWSHIGMAREMEKKHKEMTGEDSNTAITGEEGIEAFRRILSSNRLSRIVVMERDLDVMIERYSVKETEPEAEVGKPDISTQPVFNRPELSSRYIPPGNRTEQVLADTWERFFGFDRVGIADDFFELGGDSLKATILVSKIHKELHVKLPLTTVFRKSTIKELAEYIDGAVEEKFVSISPVEKKECYAMSSAQKRIYLLQRKDPETTAFNLYMVIPLQEETRIDKIEAVFRKLILRHESLRTSFEMVNDEPMQRIHSPGDIKFKIECHEVEADEVSGEIDPQGTTFLDHRGGNRIIRPFDLSKTPLLRVESIRSSNGRSALLVDMHHTIADGVSHDVLQKDFAILYRGEVLPGLRIQYKDFSEWQNGLSRNPKEREAIKKQERYWLNEFRDKVPLFNMSIDYERSRIRKIEGASIPFEIGSDVTRDLRRIAREEETTMFMVLLAVYNVFLARISTQEDIVVGSPIAGRSHTDLEQIIGMFVNILALRNFPASGKPFKEFLREVKKKAVAAFENGDYHFENLVEKLELERDPARTPLFEVIFSFHTTASGSNRAAEAHREPGDDKSEKKAAEQHVAAHRFKKSNYDIILHCRETEEKIFFIFEYGRRLFKKETIEKFILYLKGVAVNVAKNPDLKLSEIEVVSEEEKVKLLERLREKRGIVFKPGKVKNEGRNEKIGAEFDL